MLKKFLKSWSHRKRLVMGVSNVMIAKILSSIFSVIIFVFLARIFSVESLGLFSFFTSIAVIVTVASNWGVNEYILREGAASPGKLKELVLHSVFIKGSLGLAFGLLTSGYFFFKETALFTVLIFWLILLFTLIDSQTITFIVAFRSQGNTRFEAWFFPSRNACRLITLLIISVWSIDIFEIVSGMVLVNLAGLLVARHSFKQFWGEPHRGKINLQSAYEIVKSATPFVLLAVIGMTYARADQIMLGIMKGSREVGIYALAWQAYETAAFLPTSIYVVLLPKLTKIFNEDAFRWAETGAKAFWLAFLLACVIGIVFSIALPHVIRFLFGSKYLSSEPLIRVLMVAYIFNFVWVALLISLLISGGNTRILNVIVISSLTLNIIANLYAIPRYGPLGAAYSTVLSEVFTFVAGTWWLLRKIAAMKLALAKTT